MSSKELSEEDFKNINLPANCTSFNVLVAVGERALYLYQENNKKDNNQKEMICRDTNSWATALPLYHEKNKKEKNQKEMIYRDTNSWATALSLYHEKNKKEKNQKEMISGDANSWARRRSSKINSGFSFAINSGSKDACFPLQSKNSSRWLNCGEYCNLSQTLLQETSGFSKVKPSKRPLLYEESDEIIISKKRKPNIARVFLGNSNYFPIEIQPPLPMEFKESLTSLNKDLTIHSEVLVIQKALRGSDISRQQNRFSIPLNRMMNKFLTDAEIKYLETRDQKGKNVSKLEVNLIDPLRRNWMVNFRRWEMCKDSTKRKSVSVSYVINGPWAQIVSRNKLEEGDVMQLWAARVEESLWFALVRLPRS